MSDPSRRESSWPAPAGGGTAPVADETSDSGDASAGPERRPTVHHPPNVFISYRRADCTKEAAALSARLRTDLTGEVVYRDADPFAMLPGDDWVEAVDEAIASSDASIFLVGDGWPGYVDGDGEPVDTPRITSITDEVRREVESTLALVDPPRVIPIYVGLDTEKRKQVERDSNGFVKRFDALRLQRLDMDRGALTGDDSIEYQQVLVSVWVALKERNPGSILVIGDATALVDLDKLVEELISARRLDRSELSRFSSGAYLLRSARSRRHGHRLRKKAPDVIIAVNAEDPTEQLVERVKAVVTHPYVRRVTLVAVGSGAAGAAGALTAQAAGWGTASGTTVTTSSAAAAIPSASLIGGLTVGGKIAAAAVAASATGAVAVGTEAILPDPATLAIEIDEDISLATSRGDDAAYPLGAPRAISVELSPPTTSAELTTAYADGARPVERNVVVDLFGEQVEVGSIDYPTDWSPFNGSNGPGEYTLDTVSTSAVLPVSGVGTHGWCYELADRTNIVAGWALDGDEVDLEVSFSVVVGDDGVEGTRAYAQIIGRATRVAIDPNWDFSEGTQCDESSDQSGLFWSSN